MCIELVRRARVLGASDLHLTVGAVPVARICGNLQALSDQPADTRAFEGLLNALPVSARTALTQSGEADCAVRLDDVRCRVNVFRQGEGYAAAVRLLASVLPSCEELGVPSSLSELTAADGGLILLTGSTGSGKSTTLAALTQRINMTRAAHIITLEDPVEYLYPAGRALIHQREIGRDTASFASGLRAALREDPDVIIVGELRDAESMGIALTAAETGHLVLATLHTQDVESCLHRFIDALPQQRQVCDQLADSLLAVARQRLLPRADGHGRVAAFELLVATEAVRHLLREGRTQQLASFMQTGSRVGMLTLAESMRRLRCAGII
jgi:twitching motility protein PilT